MATPLGDPPLRAQVMESNGELSRQWAVWIRQLFERVGKNSGSLFPYSKLLIEDKLAEGSQTTQYTVPATTQTVIDEFTVTNTDSVVHRISINVVPSGGTAGPSNLVLPGLALIPGETFSIGILYQRVMETGQVVSTLASVSSKIVIRMSGREVAV